MQEWLKGYREGGITGVLHHKPRVGRSQKIPQWAQEALQKQLQQEEGFNSYGEIRHWLQEKLGIESTYKNVHDLVHYRFKAAPKVARPYSASQKPEQVEAYKKLSENLAMVAWYVVAVLGLTGKVRFFCQDETRLGLKTISGRKITARGVKPQAKVQWQFQATWRLRYCRTCYR